MAHQKLALARRGAGDLAQALHFIGIALLSDPATRDDGLLVLDQAIRTAARYGLVHQLRSIEGIKAPEREPDWPPATVTGRDAWATTSRPSPKTSGTGPR